MKRAMFVGRWQPFHNGHKWLIDQKLSQGIPTLIAVRDIPPDNKNPFTTVEDYIVLFLITIWKPLRMITSNINDRIERYANIY